MSDASIPYCDVCDEPIYSCQCDAGEEDMGPPMSKDELIDRLRAIASKAIREQVNIRQTLEAEINRVKGLLDLWSRIASSLEIMDRGQDNYEAQKSALRKVRLAQYDYERSIIKSEDKRGPIPHMDSWLKKEW